MDFTINVKKVPIVDIKPYYNNPRKNYASIDLLEEAFYNFEYMTPITVDKNYVIVSGHSRFYAAKAIGIEKVDIVVLDKLPDSKIKEFRIVDNKTQEAGIWAIEGHDDLIQAYAAESRLFRKMYPEFAFSQIQPDQRKAFVAETFEGMQIISDDDMDIEYSKEKMNERPGYHGEIISGESDEIETAGVIAHNLVICPYCYFEFKANK